MNQGSERKNQRYTEMDIAKGLGILFVILGHALKQTGVETPFYQTVITVIYSFHMPFFFLLSGFMAVGAFRASTLAEKGAWIRKRAARLLIPYFAIGILYVPVKLVLSRYALKPYRLTDVWRLLIGENPDTVLWYLYVLFWISTAVVLLVRERTCRIWVIIALQISLIAYRFNLPWRTARFAFFFLLGMEWRLHYGTWRKFFEKPVASYLTAGAGCVVFAVCCAGLCIRGWTILTVPAALGASAALYCLSCKAAGIDGPCSRILRELGEYSMDIYIFSEPIMTCVRLLFWNILHLNVHVCSILCFVIPLLISIPVSKGIVRRVPLFRKLFLGMD